MIIYLDESKKLGQGKIVFGGFITNHKHSFINKYVKEKSFHYGIKNIDLELKSTKGNGKLFYDKMINDPNFDILKNNIVGINVINYYNDNLEKYIKIMCEIVGCIYPSLKNYNKDIFLTVDRVDFGKKTRKIEKFIENEINKIYHFKRQLHFKFESSKGYCGIQIADLIAYQLRIANINKTKCLDNFIIDNSFNIDLLAEFKA